MRHVLVVALFVIALSISTSAQIDPSKTADEAKIEAIKQLLVHLEEDRIAFVKAKNETLNSTPSSQREYAPSEIDKGLANAIVVLDKERTLTSLTLDFSQKRFSRVSSLAELRTYADRLHVSNQQLANLASSILTNEQQQVEIIKQMQQAYHNREAARWNSLNTQYEELQRRVQPYSASLGQTVAYEEEIMRGVEAYLNELLERLQKKGFTGTVVVHMTAKSWIDGTAPGLATSFKGVALQFGDNKDPKSPRLDPDIDDFKLYQTFVAEAKFVDGKVVSARFLPESFDIRAAKTFKTVTGLIYVKESTISKWQNTDTVTFTRTVQGRPNLVFVVPLETMMEQQFREISNTLSVEIKGDQITPHGSGTDFPSHKFWIGDKLFFQKTQVPAAQYFK